MRALLVTAPGQTGLGRISAPEPAADEALVRIRGCGVCSSTDRALIDGSLSFHAAYPCVLGHEAIGEVIAVGRAVRSFAVGDLVTRPAAIWPGETRDGLASAWGGFADYGIVRDHPGADDYLCQRQRRVPPGTSLAQAVLAISLAETASVVDQLGPLAGARVLIAGTGIAGLSAALWCGRAGAEVTVLGRRVERLELAARLTGAAGITEAGLSAAAAHTELYLDAIGDHALCTRIRALLPATARCAVYSVLDGHADLPRPPAEEHRCYDAVCAELRAGSIRVEEWLGPAWPLARYAEAFAAVAAGSVLKTWIRCDDEETDHA